ncbi:MAG TPA: S9 family peptidase [Chthonomonadaceae bacterium]|nr:S9 family peptidase [Chthonomonadaceae bacterium]
MPRKITADDFQRIQTVSDPQVAPNGTRIACVKRHIDPEKNKYRGEIWMMPTGGGEPRRFTGGEWSDSSPRWSPGGTQIAFLSDRQKPKNQIFLIPADGGEARPLTKLEAEGGIQALRWSPDGSKLAFLFRTTPEAWRKEAVEERKTRELPPPPRIHKSLNYRTDGFGYYDDSYWQVWVADARTGAAMQLTLGDFHCDAPIWSPDSKTLAFCSDRRADNDILLPHEDLWTVPAEGGELTRIPTPPGSKGALAWSPDGKLFAYAGNPDPGDPWGTNNTRLFLLPAAGGDTVLDLTGPTDMSLGYLTLSDVHDAGAGDLIQWSSDGKHLFCAVSAFGDTRLAAVSLPEGEMTLCTAQGREMGGFSVSRTGFTIAFTSSSPTTPQELYLFSPALTGGGTPSFQQRTQFNQDWLEEVQLIKPEPVSVPNGEGGEVPGWILKPTDLEPGQKAPLVLYIHGGPHAQYGNSLFQELQWLVAEGYAVLYTNPRGSKGYGEAHTKAIWGQWGGPDYRDLMAATDYAVSLPYVDATKTAVMGGSYGGYMTALIIGKTDRFTCAIADRLVSNRHSMSGTTDFAWHHDVYFKGTAWDNPLPLLDCSPISYAHNVKTPLLLIHSDGDLRCPVSQAEEMFAALRLQRKTVEFVRYPAETSHGMSRGGPPNLRLDRLQRNLEWLDRWLKP